MPDALSACDAPAPVAAAVNWLVDSGLGGSSLPDLVAGLGQCLNDHGIAVARAGCAILTLHPQIVSQEITWVAETGRATTRSYTPSLMEDPGSRNGPYFELALNRMRSKRYRLEESPPAAHMSLLARLRAEGHTEYFGFFHATGGASAVTPFARRVGFVPCVVGSFATRRPGGFSEAEIGCLQAITPALALAATARMNFETSARLLDIYLGRSCGSLVLDGRITRGDSELITCGIWFCDLRQSSRLVAQMPLGDYVALLNRYFDITIGAVMDAGGEVLKLIGDAVMGIFRSDRPGSDTDMRERALAAAMRTLADMRDLHLAGRPAEVGIGLHVGEVMYGNVGTDERLDFTVIGRAVHEAARLQALTKPLARPVLASASFAAPIADRFTYGGAHPVAEFDDALAVYVPRP